MIENKNKNKYSTDSYIEKGVPQESVLDPILFIIYMNYSLKIHEKNIVSFTDDKTVIGRADEREQIQEDANNNLQTINNWLIESKLC